MQKKNLFLNIILKSQFLRASAYRMYLIHACIPNKSSHWEECLLSRAMHLLLSINASTLLTADNDRWSYW